MKIDWTFIGVVAISTFIGFGLGVQAGLDRGQLRATINCHYSFKKYVEDLRAIQEGRPMRCDGGLTK